MTRTTGFPNAYLFRSFEGTLEVMIFVSIRVRMGGTSDENKIHDKGWSAETRVFLCNIGI
jgi:hypothetical protein